MERGAVADASQIAMAARSIDRFGPVSVDQGVIGGDGSLDPDNHRFSFWREGSVREDYADDIPYEVGPYDELTLDDVLAPDPWTRFDPRRDTGEYDDLVLNGWSDGEFVPNVRPDDDLVLKGRLHDDLVPNIRPDDGPVLNAWPDDDSEFLRLVGALPHTLSPAARDNTPVGSEAHQDGAYRELDALADEFASIEHDRAVLEARRVSVLHRGRSWALSHADDVIDPSETRARRRELAHRAMVAEFATRAHLSERTLATQVDRAVALGERPDVHAALADGVITPSHAAAIVDEVETLVHSDGLPPADDVVRAFEERLLERAAVRTPGEVRRMARRLREKVLPESIEVRHHRARDARSFWIEPLPDAMARLHLTTSADSAALIHAGFTSEAIRMQKAGDDRTMDQLRSDLAVTRLLADGRGIRGGGMNGSADAPVARGAGVSGATRNDAVHADTGSTDRGSLTEEAVDWPQILPGLRVLVTVPVLTLAGLGDEPGQLDGYGPIPPEMARRMAAHAPSLTRILTHPASGAVLDVDRTMYKVPAALRTWLMLRDGTCRFPGCTRRATGCETDHTIAWESGGPTSAANLEHLCRKHHTLKHKTGWAVAQRPRGVLEWTSPTGMTHVTNPDDSPPHDRLTDAHAAGPDVPGDHAPRDHAPRDRAPRDHPPKDDAPRDHPPKDDAPRDHPPKDDALTDPSPADHAMKVSVLTS